MIEQVSMEQFGYTLRTTISGQAGRYFALARKNPFTAIWEIFSPVNRIGPTGLAQCTFDLGLCANTKATVAVISAADSALRTNTLMTNPIDIEVSAAIVPAGVSRFNGEILIRGSAHPQKC